jgi:hypothetical protein
MHHLVDSIPGKMLLNADLLQELQGAEKTTSFFLLPPLTPCGTAHFMMYARISFFRDVSSFIMSSKTSFFRALSKELRKLSIIRLQGSRQFALPGGNYSSDLTLPQFKQLFLPACTLLGLPAPRCLALFATVRLPRDRGSGGMPMISSSETSYCTSSSSLDAILRGDGPAEPMWDSGPTWGLCGVAVYWQGSLESWSALAYKQHAAIPQKKTAQNHDWPKGVSHGIHHGSDSQI